MTLFKIEKHGMKIAVVARKAQHAVVVTYESGSKLEQLFDDYSTAASFANMF